MPNYRKGKNHGLYFHSSPPKVLPMNNQVSSKPGHDQTKEAIIIKPSNIRIWIHDKDIAKLTKVLWEGQGMRLRSENCANQKVKKFLDATPYILNVIKDVHSAAADNDLEFLKSKTAPPVPPELLSSKDANGLTALHKAAGLAHTRLVEYLLSVWPNAATERDATGKLPLHWAASAKNNDRCFNLLVQAGADETATDNKMKTAAYYKQKPNDIDRSLLTIIPEAPRIPNMSPAIDWSILSDVAKNSQQNNVTSHKNSLSFIADNNNSFLDNQINPLRETSFTRSRNGSLLPNFITDNIDNTPEIASPEMLDMNGLNNNGEIKILSTEEEAVLAAISDKPTRKLRQTAMLAASNYENHQNILNRNLNGNQGDDYDTAVEEKNKKNVSEIYDLEGNAMIIGNGNENNTSTDQDDNKQRFNEEDNTNEEAVNYTNNDAEPNDDYHANGNDDENNNDVENNEEIGNGYISNNENYHDKDDEAVNENGDNDDDDDDDDDQDFEGIMLGGSGNAGSGREHYHHYMGQEENNKDNDERPRNIKSALNGIADEIELDYDPSYEGVVDIQSMVNDRTRFHDEDKDDDDDAGNDKNGTEQKSTKSSSKSMKSRKSVASGVSNGVDNGQNGSENVESPSPALEIEGVVRGEPDNGQLQSQGGVMAEEIEDSKIQSIIDSGDMEQLAAIVLNGEGNKLVGMQSDQPEIQAFLDNVTAYMNKIRRVHLASREGNLRDLQSALDRRKFAIAKDEVSPHGATPLHVATIFGHAGIVRYLAGRFPETTNAVDDNKRTALHYAATLSDNGHFYNLLVHLGANSKAIDDIGNTAEFYMNHINYADSSEILSHKQLLRDYGVQEELADEMLHDQESSNADISQVEIPLFKTEEGRYLATTLGDPLIKGLTEVANKRPENPISFLANYLFNFANKNEIVDHPESPVKPMKYESNNNNPASTSTKLVAEDHNDIQEDLAPSPDDTEMPVNGFDRDEHGQSMLHFACARTHGRNALIQLIEESGVSITYRDELYRTARDVSLQASQPNNAIELDKYVISLAARGELESFSNMILDGYDHILDASDPDGHSILSVAQSRDHQELITFFESLQEFEENREKLHNAIRKNDVETIREILSQTDGQRLAKAKNYYGRTTLHIAILKENEEVVEFIAKNFKQTLKIGDNLERTPLHYAMGVNSVEAISRILIKNGAKRVLKDLKGRQPSYYFMNKADILRLQEEED